MKRLVAILAALCLLVPAGISVAEQPTSKTLLPYTGEPVTITMMGWESFKPLVEGSKLAVWMKEKLGNIDLVFDIPVEATQQKIETALASGQMDDIIIHRDPEGFIANYGDGSRTVNLLDYAEYMPEYIARRDKFPHLSRYDVDGKTHLILPAWYDLPTEVWFAQKDILEKYDCEIPTNYEEMKAVMDKVLPNEPEMFGLLFHTWGIGHIFTCYSHLFGGVSGPMSIYYDYAQEKWVYGILGDVDVSKKTTEAMAEAYQKGYLSKDFLAYADWEAVINNSQALFMNVYLQTSPTADNRSFLKYEPILIAPPAQEGVTPFVRADYTSDVTFWSFAISNTTKHPELAASILEFISSEEFAQVSSWGWEGETYEVVDGKKQFTEEYLKLSQEEAASKYGLTGSIPYCFSQLISTTYVGDARIADWVPALQEGTKDIGNKLHSGEYAVYYGRVSPKFDAIVSQDNSVVKTAVDTFVAESLTNFIIGNKPLTEWDDFIREIPSYGDIEGIVKQYNDAEQRPDRQTQFERTYVNMDISD